MRHVTTSGLRLADREAAASGRWTPCTRTIGPEDITATPDAREQGADLNPGQGVTAASLTTAPNTAFLTERIALFSIVMGVALLLLTGSGSWC
jgi:hypothetical protein